MPHTPFTRFLAWALVVLTAVALFWPDDRALQWAAYGSGAVVILVMMFTWSVVKNSPPLDDRAFHRCLPPGPGREFLRTIWIHLLVLGAVALGVLVYCGMWNFSWRAASWGVVMLTVPAWVLMSAVGIASSAGSSQQHRKSAAWFAIFATPVFSTGLLQWLNRGVDPSGWDYVYFTPERTTVLTGATLYPLVWWLVAARKRRTLGLVLGGATSALLPWLVLRGDFVKVREMDVPLDPPASEAAEKLTLSRKPFAGSDKTWIPVEDLIEIDGLAEGEHTCVALSVEFGNDPNRGVPQAYGSQSSRTRDRQMQENFGVYELRDNRFSHFRYPTRVGAFVSKQGGKIVWGKGAVDQSLRKLLPPVESFEYSQEWQNVPPSPPVVRNPADPSLTRADFPTDTTYFAPLDFYKRVNPTSFRAMPWTVAIMNPCSWKLLGSCAATEGTSFRLETGRMLKVLPLKQEADGNGDLRIRHYREELWQARGPWFGADEGLNRSEVSIAIVAIDEAGKHAYLIGEFSAPSSRRVMLGRCESFTISTGVGGNAGMERAEMMRKSRLYVFMNQTGGFARKVVLPGVE
ncbi:hypothetical protein [Luteolibacter soli]|uniref:Uncharacterized protein n=1 Tax=Luteolibacter soli TaxID=3135280 RepID=A0ABU9AVN2_9BACT